MPSRGGTIVASFWSDGISMLFAAGLAQRI
jgi:hypothetical protein